MKEKKLYNKYLEGKHWEKHPTIYAESFVNFLNSKGVDGLIIDIGCGDGRDTNVFFKDGFDVVGVDYSSDIIKEAMKKHPKVNFDVDNAECLNIKDDSVSGVYMINVIHYTNQKKAISEVFRVLESGGYFFIHFNLEIKDVSENVDYLISEEDVLDLVSDFKVIKRRTFERVDEKPIKHTHKIFELILQK